MLTDDSFGMEAASILFEDTNQVEHEKREHRRLQNRLAQRKRRRNQRPLHGKQHVQQSAKTLDEQASGNNCTIGTPYETLLNHQFITLEGGPNFVSHPTSLEHNVNETGMIDLPDTTPSSPLTFIHGILPPTPPTPPTSALHAQVPQTEGPSPLFNTPGTHNMTEIWANSPSSDHLVASMFEYDGYDSHFFNPALSRTENPQERTPDQKHSTDTLAFATRSSVQLKSSPMSQLSEDENYQTRERQRHLRTCSEGETTLHLAAANGHVGIVNCLLDFEVDIESRDDHGGTALHHAARNGRNDTLSALIDRGASVEATDHEGWTALHMAASNGHGDIVRLLIQRGVNLHARIERK